VSDNDSRAQTEAMHKVDNILGVIGDRLFSHPYGFPMARQVESKNALIAQAANLWGPV
jgi:hypothetical protein